MQFNDNSREEFERWRFNIDDLLVEKEKNLLGLFWDSTENNGRGAWVKKGESRVNEKGAKAIITTISGVVNKISTLSQLNIDEIMMEIKMLHDNLNRLFFLHHDEYGIKSPSDSRAILWEIVFFSFNGLKQSEGAAAMKSLAEIGPTARHIYQEVPAQKQGFLHLPGRGN